MSKPDFYYYAESEWDRLGCGPLPESRKRPDLLSKEAKFLGKEEKYLVYPEPTGYDLPVNPYGQH
jgi:hypothetical protein